MAIHHVSDPTLRPLRAADAHRTARVLVGRHVTLRLLTLRDAPSLVEHLNTPGVIRFAAPPSTLAAMRGFIRWTQRARRQGRYLVYGVIPAGETAPVGVAQLGKIEGDFSVAELGFVLGEAFWNRGLFARAVSPLLDLAFDELGAHRLEARIAEENLRGLAVMRKLGAVREAVLRESARSGDQFGNHVLWSLLAHEWRARAGHPVH